MVQRTTLMAAWWWMQAGACVTALWIALDSGLQSPLPGDQSRWALIRFGIACVTSLPMVAVLGAKRPQHKAWQVIVGSLLFVLCLPIAQNYAFPTANPFSPHPAWASFLVVLFGMGPLNYLATPHAFSALLVFAGQLLMLAPFLPYSADASMLHSPRLVGFAFLSAAALELLGAFRRRPRKGWNGAWKDFRDLFGAFWVFRVIERAHDFSQQFSVPWVLGWKGFAHLPTETTAGADEKTAPYLQSLRGVWMRFVDDSWLQLRISQGDSLSPMDGDGVAPRIH